MRDMSKNERRELIGDLIQSFALCKTVDEAILFLEDLITKKELEMLARRLRIAKFLIDGYNYREIQNMLHVGHGTIAKVSYWLSERGEGFRRILKSLPKDSLKDPLDESVWDDLKRKYPTYFLPELIAEGIAINIKQKRKRKIIDSV